jgi:hypothetical protein
LITAIGWRCRGRDRHRTASGELGVAGRCRHALGRNERLLKTPAPGPGGPKPSRELGKLRQRLVTAGYRGSEASRVLRHPPGLAIALRVA